MIKLFIESTVYRLYSSVFELKLCEMENGLFHQVSQRNWREKSVPHPGHGKLKWKDAKICT